MSAAASLLASLPLGGKSLAGVLVGSYLLGLGAPGFRAYFSLVAGKVFVRPWQILTSGLVEDSLPAVREPASLFACLCLRSRRQARTWHVGRHARPPPPHPPTRAPP